MEQESATLKQERTVCANFRFHMRSVALLENKGKCALGITLIILMAFILAMAITLWQQRECRSLSAAYKICNLTLYNMDNGICYRYSRQEKNTLNRFYKQCIVRGQCKRNVITHENLSLPVHIFSSSKMHDHIFYVNDFNDGYLVINNTCVLNAVETAALFSVL